ncbi:MAG: hypothetical protein NTV06_09145, partial [candidate division Zixibacteria bacterium]|nr:hypothetical protein [candidate division Zixibacteria bacterium]
MDRLLTDIDIAYIYENEAVIDWPLIYYLGAEKGCHISLITAELSPAFDCQTAVAENYNLTSACLFVPDTTEIYFDSAFTKIYSQTLPDLVIFASVTTRPEMRAFENYLLRQKYDTSRI